MQDATIKKSAVPRFEGIWVPLVTPFADGEVDEDNLRKLVRHVRGQGVQGLLACGSAGEAAALNEQEQARVLDTVLAEAGDLPVIMGLIAGNQGAALAMVREWGRRPLAGLLVAAPPYALPAQDGLLTWFRAIADAAPFPVILQDVPHRTGVRIAVATLLALAAHPNIAAVSDCAGSDEKTLALITDGRLQVLAGDDLRAFITLCMGGGGCLCACANLRPDLFVALYQAVRAGQLAPARALFHLIAPLAQLAGAEPSPGPLKAALAALHGFSAAVRPPLLEANPVLQDALVHAAAALQPAGAGACA